MRRRDFITHAGALGLAGAATGPAIGVAAIPVIDAHVHLFDASRPQGAPYTGSKDYKGGVSLPAMYDKIAQPAGIVGAVVVEVSPWLEDNLWILEQAQTDPMFVGVVGMLEPDKADFPQTLERFAKNRLFRGIRYGKLWGFDITRQVDNTAFINGLKHLAAADLSLDTANPDMELIQTVLRINDKVPNLRIVIDHLPGFELKPDEITAYQKLLAEFVHRPTLYAKLSNVEHRVEHQLQIGLAANKSRLDLMQATFGEDRLIFNTNYPQSVGTRTIPQIVQLMRDYYATRSREAAEKAFWRNSLAFYKWVKRSPDQPSP
jgi:L-fuconolactonase